MTMEELYSEMKAILKFFDLSFGEMDQVTVYLNINDEIVFEHQGRKVSVEPAAFKSGDKES
jgi:hypothetical protein